LGIFPGPWGELDGPGGNVGRGGCPFTGVLGESSAGIYVNQLTINHLIDFLVSDILTNSEKWII
jgi:hypothetical protein